jgi:hypothetical protein
LGKCPHVSICEASLTAETKSKIKNLRENYKDFSEHQTAKTLQWEAFTAEVNTLQPGKILLVLDFKQDIILGKSLEEGSSLFYNATHRTILGVAMLWRETASTPVCCHFFDLLSNDLTHDAYFVSCALDKIYSSEKFQALLEREFSSLSIWLDKGRHFHNQELLEVFLSQQRKNGRN